MRVILGIGLALVLVCGAAADDKKDEKIDAKLLVGKWKQVEPKNGPQVALEFTADGKVTGAAEAGGKSYKISGTYQLTGNKIVTVTMVEDQKTEGGGTITKLTQDVLEMTDVFDIKISMKRVETKK